MRRHLALVVIVASASLGVLVPRGAAGDMADTREPVQRTEAEKAFVLDQMRLFLTSIMEIEEGLGADNLDQVARAAAARGRKANATLARPPALAAKESDAWKSMIGLVRSGFDGIAEEATAHAPAAKLNAALADTMRTCVACHQTYRISVDAP